MELNLGFSSWGARIQAFDPSIIASKDVLQQKAEFQCEDRTQGSDAGSSIANTWPKTRTIFAALSHLFLPSLL